MGNHEKSYKSPAKKLQTFMMAAGNDALWRKLYAALGQPELATDFS